MTLDEQIEQFLAGSPHAVVGASRDRAKYGNKVLRVYMQNQRPVYPVNPNAETVEGLTCYPDLASLPEKVHGISIVTPPHVTEQIVEQAAKLGIQNVWTQPGAESDRAVARAKQFGMNVIAGVPCALVVMGFRESTDDDSR
jgi:predicted CoA-binding protein